MPRKKDNNTFKFRADSTSSWYTVSTDAFKTRIEELLTRAKRLAEMEASGFHYRKVWVEPTKVKAHNRAGYHAMRPVKKKGR